MDRNEEKKYPISEIFVSPQGEGVYAGVMMCFVRLSGCTVGKPYPKEMYAEHISSKSTQMTIEMEKAFPIYTEKCTLYDGREFACDTDYRVKERLTSRQILQQVPNDVDHVCITGGEPAMHDLSNLLMTLHAEGKKKLHMETSGTIDFDMMPIWLTVSPKKGVLDKMLYRADELKILIDSEFNPLLPIGNGDHVSLVNLAKTKPVYLQPVNYEHSVNSDNVKLCMKYQSQYPQFRVCLQLHKVISQYTKEIVR